MDLSFIQRTGYKLVRFGQKYQSNAPLNLTGDRDLEWSWAVAQTPVGTKRILDVGPGNSMIPVALSFVADEVIALDINSPEVQYGVQNIQHILGDVMKPPGNLGKFDVIINCSTIEHVGLPGRYGSKEEKNGDLIGMEQLSQLMHPDSKMILTIPVGLDGVFLPNHRVYGNERLPQLLQNFEVDTERYFEKTETNKFWHETTKSKALGTLGSLSFYSIGLYVLRKR
jgi:hypothetical protein